MKLGLPSRRTVNWCVILLSVCIILLMVRIRFPYDEVTIDIRGLPADGVFACMIANTDAGLQVMKWYGLPMIIKEPMHPDQVSLGFFRARNPNDIFHNMIQWIDSRQIGILLKTVEGKWRIYWIDPPKSKLKGRSVLFGRGSIEVDISDTKKDETITTEQLKHLGMRYSLTHNN